MVGKKYITSQEKFKDFRKFIQTAKYIPSKISRFVLKKTCRRKEKQKKFLTLNWDLAWYHRDINLPATASVLRRPCLVR